MVKQANWSDVIIHNCKIEDFDEAIKPDLVFTSIPYYNIEIYSNNINYKSSDEWKNSFIKAIERYGGNNNCFINTTEKLSNALGWNSIDSYIISNKDHFDKGSGYKKEVIVKL
jgi:hypothetical protein